MVGPPRWYYENAAARNRYYKTGKAPKTPDKGKKKKDKKTKDKTPKPTNQKAKGKPKAR